MKRNPYDIEYREPISPHQLGNHGEDIAARHLENIGYRISCRSFRLLRGEIDIIATDGNCLVFVEVKTRHPSPFGNPEDAVSLNKQRQLKRIAEGYLVIHGIKNRECRFDVISLIRSTSGWKLKHFKRAFE